MPLEKLDAAIKEYGYPVGPITLADEVRPDPDGRALVSKERQLPSQPSIKTNCLSWPASAVVQTN